MTTREFEIIHSDRIELVREANEFVGLMVNKQTNAFTTDMDNPEIIELDKNERETYDEALNFLKRQFCIGFRESEILEKMVEKEDS